jgi:hypoxanthine phosphoribosyltransferase
LRPLKVLLRREKIDERIAELAAAVGRDYDGRDPILIGVLKGCFVFMSDLIRKLEIPVEVEFVRLSSYGPDRSTSGRVKLTHGISRPLRDRHILVIEDIVDTGLTVRFVLDYLGRKRPASLKVCTLFDKPSRRQVEVRPDYVGFTVPDEFVVWYGLDCDEKWRHLPDLCVLEE